MFRHLLLVGLLAGLFSGTLLTVLQYFSVLPLIQQAEQYENTVNASPPADAHGHEQAAMEWQPREGSERLAFTWLANLGIAAGFGLMMAGFMTLRPPRTLVAALIFGIGGYYVFFVAPVLLLPPELPGSESHDLQARQATWLVTVIFSLVGLSLLTGATYRWKRLLGFVTLCSPFLLFSRHEVNPPALAPPALIEQFAWLTGITNLIFWIALGGLVYWLHQRWVLAPRHPSHPVSSR